MLAQVRFNFSADSNLHLNPLSGKRLINQDLSLGAQFNAGLQS